MDCEARWALRREQGPVPGSGDPSEDSEQGSQQAAERAIVCARCGSVVTRPRERIEIDGTHEHTFLNPAGLIYRIGCFSRAEGVGAIGAPSGEYAWFKGTVWQVAVCRGCGEHLGWLFRSDVLGFAGLIVDRLRDV